MRKDLVDKAKLGAQRPEKAEVAPEGEPQATARGASGVLHVQSSDDRDKPRAKPWKVQGRGGSREYIARVATVAEGAAVAEAAAYVGGLSGLRSDGKAMRKTVKRMGADLRDGQGCLPLGDGLEGWLPRVKPEGSGD